MKRHHLKIEIEEFQSVDGLPDTDKELMNEAKKAIDAAHSPYSGFSVGAALLLDNGKIVQGNNQESVAFPSGMCAERVAIWSARSRYPDAGMERLALCVKSAHEVVDSPITPCGACRQVMGDQEERTNTPMRVVFMGEKGKVQAVNGMKNLLPLFFDGGKIELKKP